MRQPLRRLATLVFCLAALRSAAAINGTVMATDGKPVAGARVSILGFESMDARRTRLLSDSPEQKPIATTESDARGSFSLASPKDAVVDLTVFARGYAPVRRRVERDEELGAIALAKADMQSGSVTAGGKPLAGATVALNYGGYEYVTKSGADGKYEAPEAKRARSIAVIHPQYAIDDEFWMMTTSRVTAAKLQRTLVAGTELKGKVVDTDGKTAVAKASVRVDGWPLATSGDDGSFTIAHAPAKWTTLLARTDTLRGTRAFSKEATQTIRMAKAATITGRIVDTKTKVPVAGAMVYAAIPRMGPGGGETGDGAMTDAKGAFSFAIPAGSYMLFASHPAYDPDQRDVSVAAGQSSSKDLSLTPLARVTGMVVDESNKPIAAAAVSTENAGDPMRGMGMRMMRGDAGDGVASGPDGRFAIRFAADADLLLKATKKGMPGAKSETMKLAPGERKSGVVLTIPTGVAVTGKVTDADGKPLSGVAVSTSESEQGRGGMQRMIISGMFQQDEDVVTTGSDGTFSMRLKEGSYDFAFRREGYATGNVRAQSVTATANNVVDAKLDPAVEIRGRVVRNGNGVDGVNVFAMVMGTDSRTITGPDGSFVLGGLTPGQTRVSFRKDDGFVQEMRSLTAPANDVVIDLPQGSRLSGRVIDKGTRKPLTQFSVGVSRSRSAGGMVMMAPPQLKSFTSDDGSFVLENVPAGAQDLVAQAPGYAGGRMNVTVEEGKELADLELEVDAGTRLTGKVTAPNGAPLADVNVSLAFGPGSSAARTGAMNRTVTDANGEYTLEALQGGEETIEFSHPKYIGTRKDVTIKGREMHLDAQLGGGQRVTGTVVTEAGMPVADADVMAMASGGSRRSARTNAAGMFEFDSLAPARYRFMAVKSGFADGKIEDFDISDGAPLRITMRTGGTIYGRVSGLTPEELSNASVDVSGGGAFSSASVDSSGNYKLEGAPTGTVQVAASVTSRSMTGRRTTPAQSVQVEAGGSRQVDLEFSSGTVIRGRVTRNGAPMKGANITFSPRRGRTQATSSGSTDEEGRYSVTGLDEGEYNVTVIDMQRFSPYSTTYEVRGSATFDIDYKANALRGRVLDAATNTPIADANVQLRNAEGGDGIRGTRAAMTDAGGTFLFDSVPPGSYVANATKEGYGNEAIDLMVGERPPDNLELKLAHNDGVTLKVVDGRDGRALDAMVSVYDMQGRLVHESRMFFGGMEGATDTKLPLAAGRYTAWVASQGYAPRSATFTSPSTQVIPLTPGGTLVIRSKQSTRARVRLIDASGSPYPRFGSRPSGTDLNPSPGTTTLDHIAPGSYTLQLLGDNDTVLDAVRVTIAEGQVATADI